MERIIRKNFALFLCMLMVMVAQTNANAGEEFPPLTVKGKVIDSQDNSPLPGVNIVIKGTTTGTTTDSNGDYSIDVPDENAVLLFTFIGYKVSEVSVSGRTTIDVGLVPDIGMLSEVVVVGYGEQKRSDITGSVASVPKDRLSKLPVTNVMYALQGSTAGLNITQGSSLPGRTGTVSIRGVNSISASTEPLYVVDGVIFFGSTNDINPSDIESIEVLKDASAVAIYGTRGSNGVILITTKRGKTGKPIISYNGYAGVEDLAHELTPMSPGAYVQKYADYKAATSNTSTDVLPNTYEIENYNAGRTTDWIDVATQPGTIQDHNLSIRGGSENAKYYLNAGYLDQKGVVKGYQYQRYTVRSNVDITPVDFLKLGATLSYTHKNMDGGRMNLLMASAMSPYSRPRKDDGSTEIYPMYPELLFVNPLLDLNVNRIDRGNNLNGNGYIEVIPGFLKGLKYRMQGSYAYEFTNLSEYYGRSTNNLSGRADVFDSRNNRWVLENLLLYSKDIGKHHVDFTGLYSAQKSNYFRSNVSVNGFVNDELMYNRLEAGTSGSWGSYADQSTLISQMGRINYSYDSRYMASFTVRRDGYSAFGDQADKYAIFPSMALAWNMHNENFLNTVETISQLKIRLSYGKSGNQAIAPYQTIGKASSTTLAMGGGLVNGVLMDDRIGNSELKWEHTLQTNLGVDFGLLQDRITGTIEVFKSRTNDLILLRNVPRITGSTDIYANMGELKNKGLEVTLKGTVIERGDFSWETTLTYSAFRNEIVDLYGDKRDDIGNRWFIGQPRGVIYDYEKLGVWQEDEDPSESDPSAKPGDLKFKDQITVDTDGDGKPDAKDGVINADDRIVLGQTDPKWYGGISNTFHYKNFHLNIFIQTSQGAMRNNVDASYADERGRRNIPEVVGYWTPENQSNTWPGLAYTNPRGYGYPMDISYTRIKDITLSYTFPQALISKAKLTSLTAYVSGRNLYTFTDWIGWDPESRQTSRGSDNGIDNTTGRVNQNSWIYNYPYVRTICFGLNVSL
ncbi:MAG TPA: TonB-dependent receptor [Ohtaekwangia sp.]|nr:TonB-dependent receptor [Ohtaekwangia sp.]